MLHIKQDLIRSLYFYDVSVDNMEYNPEEKFLKLYLDGAFIHNKSHVLFANRTDMWLGKGVLIFKDWSSISIRRIIPGQESRVLDKSNYDKLDEILVFDEAANSVKFAGFGMVLGRWEEWTIIGSKYYGEFEEYETP